MKILNLIPVIISFLLLAAHFSRAGMYLIAAICLILLFLLFLSKMWVARLIQIYLVIGAFEWFRTLYIFAEQRQAQGESWIRLAIILSIVGLFTGLSAFAFQTKALKERYKL